MQGTSQQELPERSTALTSPHPQTSGAPRSPSVSGSTRGVADREGQGRVRGNMGRFRRRDLGVICRHGATSLTFSWTSTRPSA